MMGLSFLWRRFLIQRKHRIRSLNTRVQLQRRPRFDRVRIGEALAKVARKEFSWFFVSLVALSFFSGVQIRKASFRNFFSARALMILSLNDFVKKRSGCGFVL